MDNPINTPRGPLSAEQIEHLDSQARGETPVLPSVPEMAATISRLRQAMRWIQEFGQHPPACQAARGGACDCGLDDLKRP